MGTDLHVPSHVVVSALDAHELLGLDAHRHAALAAVLVGGTVALGADGTWAILSAIFSGKQSPSLAALAAIRAGDAA